MIWGNIQVWSRTIALCKQFRYGRLLCRRIRREPLPHCISQLLRNAVPSVIETTKRNIYWKALKSATRKELGSVSDIPFLSTFLLVLCKLATSAYPSVFYSESLKKIRKVKTTLYRISESLRSRYVNTPRNIFNKNNHQTGCCIPFS